MTTGHDSAIRPPRYSRIVAALGGLAYGLIQIALLLVGIVVICIAIVAGGARRLIGGRRA